MLGDPQSRSGEKAEVVLVLEQHGQMLSFADNFGHEQDCWTLDAVISDDHIFSKPGSMLSIQSARLCGVGSRDWKGLTPDITLRGSR